MCVIFRRITRRGRVGTLASIYGGWEGRPARLYIRSDRVEYLALLCPVHISALPPLCLFHPPSRRPQRSPPQRVAPFCDCVSRVFVSARSCALHDTSAIECLAEQEPLFSETDECLPRNAPFRAHYTQCATSEKKKRVGERIFHDRLRNFTDE